MADYYVSDELSGSIQSPRRSKATIIGWGVDADPTNEPTHPTKGHVPNIFAEKGWKADWKHNRTGLVKNVLVGAAVTTALFMLLSRNKKKRLT